MPSAITVLAALAAAFAALSPARAEAPEELRGGWLAEDIGGAGVLDRVRTRIEIGPDGAVAGSGGCNRISGSAKIDGRKISFGSLVTTEMACAPAVMDQERKFIEALETATDWEFDAARGKLIVLHRRQPLVTLARTERGAHIDILIPDASRVDRVSAGYDCGARQVDVEYANAGATSLAMLSIDGEFVVAAIVMSGSGARYAGGKYIWWTKGDSATLEDQTVPDAGAVQCTLRG